MLNEPEARAHQTFAALMWALSHPGRVYALPAGQLAAFGAIAEALVDLETSYFTEDAELAVALARTGARARLPRAAMYQFYPRLGATAVPALRDAPGGSYAYPDESATLVIGCRLNRGRHLRLSGPGIETTSDIWIDDVPEGFWAERERACRFPLGWDVFFVAGDRVVGLPRTTKVEVT